ncbi:MAG TPA: hypothetical protein VGK42_07700 [Candidatus Dormibacteraeota bacterium]
MRLVTHAGRFECRRDATAEDHLLPVGFTDETGPDIEARVGKDREARNVIYRDVQPDCDGREDRVTSAWRVQLEARS